VAQPDFCNAAMLIETGMMPAALLSAMREIEMAHGRRTQARWTARPLDLDLLVYADEVHAEAGMTIPHPRIAERNFVLYPLRDIAPDLLIPGLGRVADLAARLDSGGLSVWLD
jgi:2-amino-4-hydroxy-6-hydroxymethyldihydropteridine diphosphokinase